MDTPLSPRAPGSPPLEVIAFLPLIWIIVSLLSIPLRSIDSNRQYCKKFVQTNIKNPERSERFLDFGEDGTSGYVSKFGQIIQICKMVATLEEQHPYRYATVEPRSLQVDFRRGLQRDLRGDVQASGLAKWRKHREHRIGLLTNDHATHGLGIRIDKSGDSEFQNLVSGYRNDRFPEIQYSVEGQVDVKVNFIAKHGMVVQQFVMASKRNTAQKVPLIVDLSLALLDTPNERIYGDDWEEHERTPEWCTITPKEGKNWRFQNHLHQVSAALYCNGKQIELCIQDENGKDAMESSSVYCQLVDKRIVTLQPAQVMAFTLVLHQSAVGDNIEDVTRYVDVSREMSIPEDHWWQFSSESSSIFYRRNLEAILSLAVHFPTSTSYTFPNGATAKPITFHNQSVFVTQPDQRDTWDQALTLIRLYELLDLPNIASPSIVKIYKERIREAVLGQLVYLTTLPSDFFKDVGRYAWDGTPDPEYVQYLNNLRKRQRSKTVNQGLEVVDINDSRISGTRSSAGNGGVEEIVIPLKKTELEVIADAQETNDSTYEYRPWSILFYISLFGFLQNALRVFPQETTHVLKNELREGIQNAWTMFKKGRHEKSKLYYSDTSPFTSEYRDQLIWLESYTLATQVKAWKVLKVMNQIHPLLYGNDSLLREDPEEQEFLDSEGFREHVFSEFIIQPTPDQNNPDPKPRFLTTRWGEDKSSRLDWADSVLLISQENEYFFFADSAVHPAWIETLDKADGTFPNLPKVPRALISLVYSFRSDAVAGSANEGRRAGAVLFSKSSVNALVIGQEGEEPAYDYARLALLLDYPEISNHILEPLNFNLGRRFQKKKSDRHEAPPDRAAMVKKGKTKVDIDKLTPKDWAQVNNPPDYGQWYYYPVPEFITNNPPEAVGHLIELKEALRTEVANEPWVTDLVNLWKGPKFHNDSQKIREYLHTLDYSPDDGLDFEFSGYLKDNTGWKYCYSYDSMLSGLARNREKEGIKKLFLIMENCRVETLLPILYSLQNAPAEQKAMVNFFNIVMDTDTHRMSFNDYTLLPDNLWITEFNINFVSLLDPRADRSALLYVDGYAPKKRSGFVSANPAKSKVELPILSDISFGYRFVGDLHDRVWTCYKVVDSGSVSFESLYKRYSKISSHENNHQWQQRKCLEIDLLIEALLLVYEETENIMDHMDNEEQDYEDKNIAEPLLPPVLTASDLTGSKYYTTMHKHSTYYPWALQCCSVLKGKLTGVRDMTERWLNVEKHRAHAPRWSEKDQSENRDIIRKNMDRFRKARKELELLERRIDTKIDSVTTLKSSLEAELGLREARTSTQQATSIGLFTVVTVVFMPLGFAASILSIDFGWEDPVKSLHILMWPITAGTILFLLNLPVIYGYFLETSTIAQDWLRKRMADEKSWDFWRQKAQTLTEAEKRTMLMRDDQLHDSETNWWYWHFFMVYLFISLPVRQLHTVYQILRFRPVKDTGILKKLFCLLLSPIWIVILAVVYLVLLAYCILTSSFRGVAYLCLYLWCGPEYIENMTKYDAADREAKVALYQARNLSKEDLQGKGWQDEETNANNMAIKKLKRERGPLLFRPYRMMKLKLITELPDTRSDEELIGAAKSRALSVRVGTSIVRPRTSSSGGVSAVQVPVPVGRR